jgi:hypothetical protein
LENQNAENNPMHSSEAIGGITFFRIGLTRRAKQEHDVIMATLGTDFRASGFFIA